MLEEHIEAALEKLQLGKYFCCYETQKRICSICLELHHHNTNVVIITVEWYFSYFLLIVGHKKLLDNTIISIWQM